jgi:hypothetical protein
MAARLAETGANELNLADTTGMANPLQVRRLVAKTRAAVPGFPISIHLHDTRGLGLANMLAAYEEGVNFFDVSAGGLGGCPFVKGASGNVAAEDRELFEQIGVETGIDLKALCKAVDRYEELLGRSLPGRMNRVLKSQDFVRMKKPTRQTDRHVAAVLAALDVLGVFGKPGLATLEIMQATGFTRNRVMRLTGTLNHRGYLMADPETGIFSTGPKIFALGKVFERDPSLFPGPAHLEGHRTENR